MSSLFGKRQVVLWHAIMIVVSIAFLWPLVYTFLNAVRPSRLIAVYPPVFVFEPTIKNFISALSQYHIHSNMLNSLIISSGATAVGLVFGAASAYAISSYRQRRISQLILICMMLPYMVSLLPLYVMFRTLGLLDTHIGLILSHLIITLPQSTWILTGFIQELPRELEEAAWLDGCSRFKTLLKVVFPLIKPGLVASAALSFVLSWNNFNLSLVLSRTKTMTAPFSIYHFAAYEKIDWGGLSAAVILLMIPTVLFILIAQKHLVRGFVTGGLSE